MSKEVLQHFGLKFYTPKFSYYLVREEYAIIDSKSSIRKGEIYSDEWCIEHQANALKNFDLNMKFFNNLDKTEFEYSLENVLKKWPQFIEVKDLNKYMETKGCYIMVLDKYKQVYVGTSIKIGERIRNHWARTKKFDRLLFPVWGVETSVLSIDSFRHLDTTRIFIYEVNGDAYAVEREVLDSFPTKFVLNRVGGGLLDDNAYILSSINKRDLPSEDKGEIVSIAVEKNLINFNNRKKISEHIYEIDGEEYISYKYLDENYRINYNDAKQVIDKYNIPIYKGRRHYIYKKLFLEAWNNDIKEIRLKFIFPIVFITVLVLIFLIIFIINI